MRCNQIKKKPAPLEAGFQDAKIKMPYEPYSGAFIMFDSTCTSLMFTVCLPVVGSTN